MNDKYDIGDVAVLRCEFKNPRRGERVDPTNVTCRILKQGETEPVDIPVIRLELGLYEAEVDIDAQGKWHYRFEGTGSNKAASEGSFEVAASAF